MASYRVTLGYGSDQYSFQELKADTVGLAVLTAADLAGKGRPVSVKVRVLHKPPRQEPEWLECHVSQAVLELVPGLTSKGLA
jgi:hypothetical protein